jgi:hypothetical protein
VRSLYRCALACDSYVTKNASPNVAARAPRAAACSLPQARRGVDASESSP